MTCDHAGCDETATSKTRFGDGTWMHGNATHRQTFVHYCGPHLEHVAQLFTLCDTRREDGPFGPLPTRLPGRHPDLVARRAR